MADGSDGIIFIHAFPLAARMWDAQVAEFEAETKVLAVNLPGFGGERPQLDSLTMDEAADHVAREAGKAGIERALVCGLSMGGYVALALWRRHHALVSGFVFANTKAEADDQAGRERREALALRLRAEGNQFLVESPPPLLSKGAPTDLLASVKQMIAAQPPESIAAAALGMAERPDSTEDLGTITVPTLVITGSEDTLIPPEATKQLADGIKGSRYEVIEGVGHLSNLEAPEAFNALVAEHWAKVK